MKIGELIKRYRESHPQKNGRPMSQRAFAERAGLSNGYISMLEIGINPNTNEPLTPTMTVIKKLARAMGITVHALMSQVEDLPVDISADDSSEFPSNVYPINNVHRIPMIGSVAAGEPIIAEQEYETYVPGPLKADFALTVSGDSMAPTFLDGDVVYLQQRDDVEDGQIAAVITDDEARLKRVYHTPGGLNLVSENPRYAPVAVTSNDYNTIRILGLVIGYTRMFH